MGMDLNGGAGEVGYAYGYTGEMGYGGVGDHLGLEMGCVMPTQAGEMGMWGVGQAQHA